MTDSQPLDRRTVLGALATAGLGSLAGCSALGGDAKNRDETTSAVEADAARELAAQFAPTLYFDAAEQWFPTDPRPYTTEREGETVVDGFDAFNGYHERKNETGEQAPDPTVFYNVVQYDNSPLAVVQYWLYSAFDQFSTNFHWHDWEVLHVFVDTEADESVGVPQLYVASSHSRKVPNNEFLDPDPEQPPRILSELGSHSSALSLNERPDRFQRLPTGETFADITNRALDRLEDIEEIPVAYGLPRDEGARLPYVVPELDDVPLYEDERLPSVTRDDLVDEALTVRSFDALSSPPTDMPERSTGLAFAHEGSRDEPEGNTGEHDGSTADVDYTLVPTSEVEHIAAFVGPQLSFEFDVPSFAEDAIASHITTTSTPWTQPRYENPAADISDPSHRAALADRYDGIDEPSTLNTVLVQVTEAVTSEDAPDGEGLTTQEPTVESVLLLESDPEAAPTFGGIGMLQDVPAGEHRITVNGAGVAPHSESVRVGESKDDFVTAGVDGEIPLVARESATKLEVDADGADSDLTDFALEDDFAGRLYNTPLSGPDAVYVHRGGAYTVEVRDADDEIGAFRVNPDPNADSDTSSESESDSASETESDSETGSDIAATVRIDTPRTGKASLASYLADVAEETQAAVADVDDSTDGTDSQQTDGGNTSTGSQQTDDGGASNAVQGLAQALGAVAEAARRAAERAEAGDRGRADANLDTVVSRLERVAERLAAARSDLPDELFQATERRLTQTRRRSEQAQNANKL